MSKRKEICLQDASRDQLIDLIYNLKEDIDEACGLMIDIVNAEDISEIMETKLDRFLSTDVAKIKE